MTTAQTIAPIIPSPVRVARTAHIASAAVRPLPMAGPTAALYVPAGVVYGIGRIDASRRVADQAIACALGWREGDRLTLTASPGVVTARRDPGGMVTVPARACLAIPAVLRRRCSLRAGDRVLLAAVPSPRYCQLTDVPGTAAAMVGDQGLIRFHGAVVARVVMESPSGSTYMHHWRVR